MLVQEEGERMKTARDLIAYNDLKSRIIDPGLCTLCGACEAACPVHALRIEGDTVHYLHDCSEQMDFCPICYDVCPHSEALLLEALGFVTDAPQRRESLGYYRKIVLAQATDRKLREMSHGGGVVTAILLNSIDRKLIDGAVASQQGRKETLKLEPSIGLVYDDMFSAVDAGYFPSAVGKAFGKIVHEYGKTRIAFVGTPCQVLAMRKLESWEHRIADNLKVVIGLMCLWSFSLKNLLKGIKQEQGIDSSEIVKITLDKKYIIHTKEKVAMIPVTDAKKHILQGCLSCLDYTAELADISVGGAYPLDEWSTAIIRTKTGEEIFNSAVKNGAIQVRRLEEEPEVFTHLIEMAVFKEKTDSRERDTMKAAGKPVPPATLRLLQPRPMELSLLASLSVEQTMTGNPMSVSPETTVAELLDIMTKHHHMGYPILDNEGNLMGIATFEDVMKTDPDQRSTAKVGEIRQKRLLTVYPDDTTLKAYEIMTEHEIGRVLVVDRKNPRRLLGIITKTDIMETLTWPMKKK
jgi:coenzyme F420 hydrogenase subunit beta